LLFGNDLLAEINAFVTDIYAARTGNQPMNLLLALSAE
jgi:hypothetical protein